MSQLGQEMFEKWLAQQPEAACDDKTRSLWLSGWDACEAIWKATQAEIDAIHRKRVEYWMDCAGEVRKSTNVPTS
jgi:hypothetical protein